LKKNNKGKKTNDELGVRVKKKKDQKKGQKKRYISKAT
jgi:hypothetical protein